MSRSYMYCVLPSRRPNAIVDEFSDSSIPAFALVQRLFRFLTITDIPKDQDAADDCSKSVPNRSSGIVDGALFPVPGNQNGMVRHADGAALPQRPDCRILDRLMRRGIHNVKDVRQHLASNLFGLPSDQFFGDRIEKRNASLGICPDHTVPDTCESGQQFVSSRLSPQLRFPTFIDLDFQSALTIFNSSPGML